jgi:diguanylate cyclase
LLYLLSDQGFEAIGAENETVELRLVREFSPDLIICNIKMLMLSGYEVFQELGKDITTATIPLIFLTAQIEAEEIIQSEQTRKNWYLGKPFLPNELLTMIAEILK